MIAQYDSDDNPLGQMELGYTLFHPWIAGGQVDFDKVYVGFLTVLAHPFDPRILIYESAEMIPVGIATMPTPRNVMKIPNSFPSVVIG